MQEYENTVSLLKDYIEKLEIEKHIREEAARLHNKKVMEYHRKTGHIHFKQWLDRVGPEEYAEKRKLYNKKYYEKIKQRKEEEMIQKRIHCKECNSLGCVYVGDGCYEWCENCNIEAIKKNKPCPMN
jgi:hypothetical protein